MNEIKIIKLFLLLILLNLICLLFVNGDEKNTEESKKIAKKLCCKVDFNKDILNCIDKCFEITPIRMDPWPHIECRKKKFQGNTDPTNDKRVKICSSLREDWKKCIKDQSETSGQELKPENKDDNKLKEFAKKKFKCFKDCAEKVDKGGLDCEN